MNNETGLHIISYGQDAKPGDINAYFDKTHTNNLWLRVIGLNNPDFLAAVAKIFNIHSLTIEDIVNTRHQAKYEQDYGYSLFIVKTVKKDGDGDIRGHQFSMVLGRSFIITFEESESSHINRYIEKMSTGRTPELVAYDMLDEIVDQYLYYANEFLSKVDDLEDVVIDNIEKYDLSDLFEFKQEAHKFKRIIRPIRDIADQIMRPKNEDFSPDLYPYLKDLWDHSVKAVSTADVILETVNSLHSTVVTQLQYKLSKTMNVMTAVSVIFLPLMVITGIYGMNFDNMPELHFKYSYFAVLGIMATVGVSLFMIFVKRRII